MRQMLALAAGPREDPGPFDLDLPRWEPGTFESDAEALEAWHYWKDQLRADWVEVFDETPEWIRELEAAE